MDKKTFISELKQALSVLQEEELDDIISEYEQHIDMKQANGLTEEEAIADFGSLSQLTAEILEAYHVRADYAVNRKEREEFSGQYKNSGKWQQGRDVLARGGKRICDGMIRWGKWVWGVVLSGKQAVVRWFAWMGKHWKNFWGHKGYHEEEQKKIGQEEQPTEMTTISKTLRNNGSKENLQGGLGSFFHKMKGWAMNMVCLCLQACLWVIRMTWNGTCIGFSLLFAFLGVCCLFGLGTLTVLLLQGYPLIGVTLGCVGLVISTFSLAWLGATLLWKRKLD